MSAPLTPEEIVTSEIVTIERPGLSNIPAILPGDVLRILKEYAAQQTAAKDERIKELEAYCKGQAKVLAGMEMINNEKEARIIKLEVDNKALRSVILNNDTQHKARIAELEKVCQATANACERWSNKWAKKNDQYMKLLKKVEQLEKDKATCEICSLKITQVITERDQAFDLLKDWANVEDLDFTESPDDELSDLGQILNRRNTLLSSRENKPSFHCNNKGLHFSDPGYKPVCQSQCEECRESEF